MKNIELNSKVELFNEDQHSIYGTLYDIDSEYAFVSTVPIISDTIIFRPKDNVEMVIFSKQFLIKIMGIIEARELDGVLMYTIKLTSRPTKIQRRKFVRFPYYNTIEVIFDDELANKPIAEIEKEIIENEAKYEFHKHQSINLSSGGIYIKSKNPISEEDNMILIFETKKEPIVTKGRIVHYQSKKINGEYQYFYGIEFIGISEKKKDAVMEFIFYLMRTKISP